MQKAYEALGISKEVYERGQAVLRELEEPFRRIDEIAEWNQLKVLKAMIRNEVADYHMNSSSGYGHND
ncbi:MAG: methionine gamma-lyase family protein, partial [Lachnospiraceae bacterium]|nr:methionine gamma-lyase family protein [Lachnospiraceae bacterium]